MSEHAIALQLLDRTPHAKRARDALLKCLDGAVATEPDSDGTFVVKVDCENQEKALAFVWNAMAACGGDDHIVILEHPDVHHHWEHRAERPAG